MDCLEGMKSLPDGLVNLIVTSPPYNVGLDYNGYDDTKPYDEYLAWMESIFFECKRVLVEDGRICINVGDAKNGKITTHSDFIQIMKELGFYPLTTIIWNKNTTSNRAAWGSFMSPTCPSFPRCFEYILIFSKSHKLTHTGESTISKEDFISWSNGTWNMNTEKVSKIGHPAAFPVELPTRCIEMLTFKDDVVMDPFMGSGSTAIACQNTGRHYIGFELDKTYYDIACRRIDVNKFEKLF